MLKYYRSNKFFLFFLFSFGALYILAMSVRMPGIDGYAPALIPDMIYGKADRPYVNRQFVPLLVRGISAITPNFIKTEVHSVANSLAPVDSYITKFRFQPEYFYEYIWVLLIMYFCLLGFEYIYRKMLQKAFRARDSFYDFAPFVTLLCLPLIIRYYVYLNDFPSLVLFAATFYYMWIGDFRKMLIFFACACINKETSIVLALAFFVYYIDKREELPLKKYIQLLGIQFGIFCSIKLATSLIFRNNGGVFMEFHFFTHNLDIFFAPYPLESFAAILLFVLLVIYHWKEKPQFLRRALVILGPMLLLGIFWGWLDELRAYYYELFAVLSILITQTIYSLAGSPLELNKLKVANNNTNNPLGRY